ncbi:MAG: fumarylacetoacetase [Gemmatimonadota bacterium]
MSGPVIDETHDPRLRSWIAGANESGDFPVQNLPLGVFTRRGERDSHIGVAIGDSIADVRELARRDLLGEATALLGETVGSATLNDLLARGPAVWRPLRLALSRALRAGSDEGELVKQAAAAVIVPAEDAVMRLPLEIGDYTDFYASVSHATNVGSMFRPDNPLLPNYKWVPIGYHGRTSSIVVSGAPVRRPAGQLGPPEQARGSGPGDARPPVGPSARLDYEAELGFVVGLGNRAGEPIPIAAAGGSFFGVCLLNDWSARDVQAWEYQPLGPFLAKNFATTVSPWLVTFEALAPFRVPAVVRPEGDPQPLPYLSDDGDRTSGGTDINLSVAISTARMRESGMPPVRLSRASSAELYWTPAQLLAHHASNGCLMRPGDMLGSGTVSGQTRESRGCLLELTWRGTEPLTMPTGEERRFLEDGDEVVMTGRCERAGFVPIGFGECRGVVIPHQP